MGKEVKIGLAVIGTLLCVFGGVLAMRLKREQPANALEKVAAAEKDGNIVGKKKAGGKLSKGNKEAERQGDNPTLESGLARFASRPRGEPTDSAKRKPKTDRYGRPLDDDGLAMPAPNDSQDDVANVNPSGLPDLSESEYGKAGQADRYSRYDDATASNVALDGAAPADVQIEEDRNEEGLDMPADRFAQPTRGVSFDDLEPADEAEANVRVDEPSQGEPAPRFSFGQTNDRFASNDEPASEETEHPNGLGQEASGVRLAPVPEEDADDVRMADRDRFEPVEEQGPPPRGIAAASEETTVDAAEPLEEAVADSPRRLRQPGDGSYTVEPNDNFWRISQKVYGTGAYFKALEEHNRPQTGERTLLSVGDEISTPPLSVLLQTYPDLCPKPRKPPLQGRGAALVSSAQPGGRTYTVAEGDTLFDIARAELGKASRWAEIYELNRDQLGEDFNYLAPGMRLAMPSRDERSESTATRPERDNYRR